MSERSIRDGTLNTLLLLYLVRKAKRHGQVEDDLKLQKLAFLAEKKMVERKIRAFSYNFFRWRRGPYSGPLANDVRQLLANGLLKRSTLGFIVTSYGEDVLSQCEQLLMANGKFLEVIDAILEQYAAIAPDELRDLVYDMTIFVPRLRQTMRIGDIKEGKLILCRISEEKARHIFDLNEGWQATLELILDNRAMNLLKGAQEDALHGRIARTVSANSS